MSDEPGNTRTQAQRSERTRTVATIAALESLEELGFAGTSTLSIQKRAGLSRGRLLHQFPSKNELLIAAVQRLAESRFTGLSAPTTELPPTARAKRAIELLWDTHRDGLFWVATELWLAARLDAELRSALLPAERKLGGLIRRHCDELFGSDIVVQPKYREFREILLSSMRGIALTYSFDHRDLSTEPLLLVWHQLAIDLLDLKAT